MYYLPLKHFSNDVTKDVKEVSRRVIIWNAHISSSNSFTLDKIKKTYSHYSVTKWGVILSLNNVNIPFHSGKCCLLQM